MPLEAPTIRKTDAPGLAGLTIVDAAVRNGVVRERLFEYLPQRWRDYIATAGLRWYGVSGAFSNQRPLAMRLDALPPTGGTGGSDPDFAREQLLDEYDISAGVLNTLDPLAQGNAPVDLEIAYARAAN